jgi:hypothetical protein
LIKEGGIELTKVIYELILRILKEAPVPHEWQYGIICQVHKKGDTNVCDNYREIILLCATYKILANILNVKLVIYAKEIIEKYQGGFQRGRSTVE